MTQIIPCAPQSSSPGNSEAISHPVVIEAVVVKSGSLPPPIKGGGSAGVPATATACKFQSMAGRRGGVAIGIYAGEANKYGGMRGEDVLVADGAFIRDNENSVENS